MHVVLRTVYESNHILDLEFKLMNQIGSTFVISFSQINVILFPFFSVLAKTLVYNGLN